VKRTLILILVMCLAAGMAAAKSYELQKKSGDYTLDIRLDKNPPIIGDNLMELTIKDADGKAVTDAKVAVTYTMPPMSGMAPMNYKTDAVVKESGYQATLKFSMSGSWNVEAKITRAGKTTPVKFNVDVK
jgi:YtkA-like